MRLVDADALIKQIEDNICKPCRKRKDDYKGVRCKACQYGDEKDDIDSAPTAQPERLTDDDFETIRIHLGAIKEKLCNQHRWKEAKEYQRIIDRFMNFASLQSEIIRCKDCKYQVKEWRDDKRLKDKGYLVYGCKVLSDICGYWAWFGQDDEFCSEAERRTDDVDVET